MAEKSIYPKVTSEKHKVFGIPCAVRLESATADSAVYDPLNLELLITFNNKSRYLYHKFPNNVWIEFLKSESKGSFINKIIKNNYEFERVNLE